MANKNEAKVTFKAETDAFTDGIKAINTSIGAMNAQLKLNSAQLDGTSSDTEALRSNMKLLADAQASAGQKVELTRMKLESACAIFGENSVEADRLRKSLALAELQEANLGKKLDAASAALDAQESAFGQLSGTISQQEGELEGLNAPTQMWCWSRAVSRTQPRSWPDRSRCCPRSWKATVPLCGRHPMLLTS